MSICHFQKCVIGLIVLLFHVNHCKDFSGRSFRPVMINTSDSNDTFQLLKVANPSGYNTEVTFDGDFSTILEDGNGIELNLTDHTVQSVTSNQSIFVTIETYQRSRLIDALPIIPDENLGTHYFVVGFCRYNSACRITVAAIHDSTTIQFELKITPNVPIFGANGSEVVDPTFGVILNKGDTLSYESVGDLSGTLVSGDKPFSLFFSTIVSEIRDHKHGTTRHILPSVTLGTRHFIPHYQSIYGGLLKIVAAFGDTQVEMSSLAPIMLANRGNWILKAVPVSTGVTINSNKPILVATVELEATLGVTCPKFNSMLILPSQEQWLGNTQLVIPAIEVYTFEYTASVLTHEEDTNFMAIDCVYTSGSLFGDYPGAAYDEVEINIPSKRTHVQSVSLYRKGSIVDFEVYENETFFIGNNHSTWQFFAYIGSEFRFPLNHGLKEINQVCVPSLMDYGDYIDNDCDGHIDEDICSTLGIPDPTADCKKTDTAEVEHFLAVMYHSRVATTGNVTVTITGPYTTTIDVYSQYSSWTRGFTILQGESKELYSHAKDIAIPHPGTFVGNYGIKIVSTQTLKAVVTYQSVPNTGSAFLTYPTKISGLDYFAVTEVNGVSRCVVIATKNDTLLTVSLSFLSTVRVDYNGRIYRQGEMFTLLMQSEQTFQIESYYNLTGTRIRGNKPISVICGGENQNGGSMAEQLFPSETWGRIYKLPPLNIVNVSIITVISRENLNSVTITSSGCSSYEHFDLHFSGSYYTTLLDVTTPCILDVHGLKEISVAIYFVSNSLNDKSLLMVPSIDQSVFGGIFPVPELSSAVETNLYLGLVFVRNFVPNAVTLDGIPLVDTYTEIGPGRHRVSSSLKILPFVFAFSRSNESFSYAFMAAIKWPISVQDCIPSAELYDGTDNDCDGLVDEEECTMADPDNIMFEEDCNQKLQWQFGTSSETSVTNSDPISTDSLSYWLTTTVQENFIRSNSPMMLTTVVSVSLTSQFETTEDGTVSGETTGNGTVSSETTDHRTVSRETTDDGTVPSEESTESFTTHPNNCRCPCYLSIIDTKEKLEQRLIELKLTLQVEKSKLSSAVRKHTSAADDRTSARCLGFSGVTVLVLLVTIIILFDISTLVRDINYRIKRSSNRYCVSSSGL